MLSERQTSSVTFDLVTGECRRKRPEKASVPIVRITVTDFVEFDFQLESIIDDIVIRSSQTCNENEMGNYLRVCTYKNEKFLKIVKKKVSPDSVAE